MGWNILGTLGSGGSRAPLRLWLCFPGIPNLITADMIKEGAAVIDVGITRVQDPVTAKPRLVGDVDFEGEGKLWILFGALRRGTKPGLGH